MIQFYKLLFILVSTIIPFIWVFRLKRIDIKLFFGFVVLYYFLYSGLGGSFVGIDEYYIFYYLIYTVLLSLGLYIGKGKKNKKGKIKTSFGLTIFIEKYATKIIVIYFIIKISTLLFPVFLLHRLILPPSPNLTDLFAERFIEKNISAYESLVYYTISILTPLFFLSLYKYRYKIWTSFFLIFSIPYIDYCKNAYIGRGPMLMYLMIFIFIIYKYQPKLRKTIVIALAALIPTITIFMINYTDLRLGGSASVDNFFDAFEQIVFTEFSYPLWFSKIFNAPYDINNLKSYLIWLTTLPLPGFLKGNIGIKGDEIASLLLGIQRSERGFYIVLPGLVGESVFYFGKYLFWMHAFLAGFLIGSVVKYLSRHPQFSILFFYSAIQLSMIINRGGTGAGFPFILKTLFVFFIVIYMYTRYSFRYDRKRF